MLLKCKGDFSNLGRPAEADVWISKGVDEKEDSHNAMEEDVAEGRSVVWFLGFADSLSLLAVINRRRHV